MAIHTYLSTITLNVNGLSAPIKIHASRNEKKTRHIYMLSVRDLLENKKYKQTKNKRMEKDIPCKLR